VEVDCRVINRRVMPDGECELCPQYTTAEADKTKCQAPQCRYGERMNDDGSCVRCQEYF